MTHQNSLQDQKIIYNCDICKDSEFIYNSETNTAVACKCRQLIQYKRLYDKSGISKVFASKTFDNFNEEEKSNIIIVAKKVALAYSNNYSGKESIALLGEPGAGKTHLCIAISNSLMNKYIGVLYMQYRESITYLKQIMLKENDDKENLYQLELKKYKTAPVLYMDDLFKGKITESDINIMFDIINYRYLNGLPIIVSSELSTNEFLKIDKAIGSRIIEMCTGFIVEFKGLELNHRLRC